MENEELKKVLENEGKQARNLFSWDVKSPEYDEYLMRTRKLEKSTKSNTSLLTTNERKRVTKKVKKNIRNSSANSFLRKWFPDELPTTTVDQMTINDGKKSELSYVHNWKKDIQLDPTVDLSSKCKSFVEEWKDNLRRCDSIVDSKRFFCHLEKLSDYVMDYIKFLQLSASLSSTTTTCTSSSCSVSTKFLERYVSEPDLSVTSTKNFFCNRSGSVSVFSAIRRRQTGIELKEKVEKKLKNAIEKRNQIVHSKICSLKSGWQRIQEVQERKRQDCEILERRICEKIEAATERRSNALAFIRSKAADEDRKVKEIAFISSIKTDIQRQMIKEKFQEKEDARKRQEIERKLKEATSNQKLCRANERREQSERQLYDRRLQTAEMKMIRMMLNEYRNELKMKEKLDYRKRKKEIFEERRSRYKEMVRENLDNLRTKISDKNEKSLRIYEANIRRRRMKAKIMSRNNFQRFHRSHRSISSLSLPRELNSFFDFREKRHQSDSSLVIRSKSKEMRLRKLERLYHNMTQHSERRKEEIRKKLEFIRSRTIKIEDCLIRQTKEDLMKNLEEIKSGMTNHFLNMNIAEYLEDINEWNVYFVQSLLRKYIGDPKRIRKYVSVLFEMWKNYSNKSYFRLKETNRSRSFFIDYQLIISSDQLNYRQSMDGTEMEKKKPNIQKKKPKAEKVKDDDDDDDDDDDGSSDQVDKSLLESLSSSKLFSDLFQSMIDILVRSLEDEGQDHFYNDHCTQLLSRAVHHFIHLECYDNTIRSYLNEQLSEKNAFTKMTTFLQLNFSSTLISFIFMFIHDKSHQFIKLLIVQLQFISTNVNWLAIHKYISNFNKLFPIFNQCFASLDNIIFNIHSSSTIEQKVFINYLHEVFEDLSVYNDCLIGKIIRNFSRQLPHFMSNSIFLKEIIFMILHCLELLKILFKIDLRLRLNLNIVITKEYEISLRRNKCVHEVILFINTILTNFGKYLVNASVDNITFDRYYLEDNDAENQTNENVDDGFVDDNFKILLYHSFTFSTQLLTIMFDSIFTSRIQYKSLLSSHLKLLFCYLNHEPVDMDLLTTKHEQIVSYLQEDELSQIDILIETFHPSNMAIFFKMLNYFVIGNNISSGEYSSFEERHQLLRSYPNVNNVWKLKLIQFNSSPISTVTQDNSQNFLKNKNDLSRSIINDLKFNLTKYSIDFFTRLLVYSNCLNAPILSENIMNKKFFDNLLNESIPHIMELYFNPSIHFLFHHMDDLSISIIPLLIYCQLSENLKNTRKIRSSLGRNIFLQFLQRISTNDEEHFGNNTTTILSDTSSNSLSSSTTSSVPSSSSDSDINFLMKTFIYPFIDELSTFYKNVSLNSEF
ncbi:hypothetical protein SNEBB_009980 [Seison nebaliae]|nr:hypothetical protein SNEBB_009980 [Seison nebaliae]